MLQDPPPQTEYEKKKQTFVTRTIWTLVMIAFFFLSMFSGHIYIIIIVTAVQLISFKEVIAISNVPSRVRSLRFTKSLNWYFLGTFMYFLYGESIIYYFKHIILIDKVLLPFATSHRFISFMLYVAGKHSPASTIFTLLTLQIRLRFLRPFPAERQLEGSVQTVCLGPYGHILDRWPGSLRY